jgi:pyruvate dehydrogenase E2 component (dihydrolipoamide acetyltransferase)
MATEVVMPRLSDTMESGTVARWLKKEGDRVSRGETIAEIETDKANMEMESYAEGVLARIMVREGESAGLGEPIAVIAADEAEARSISDGTQQPSGNGAQASPQAPPRKQSEAATPTASPTQPADGAPPGTQESHAAERIKASPLARRLAQEQHVDLHEVEGTGPGGRITKEDVQTFVTQAKEQPSRTTTEQRPEELSVEAVSGSGRASQRVEMTRMQQTIARRMAQSKFSAPEFYLTIEIDMTEARQLLRHIAAAESAPKVGPNDLLIKAAAVALQRHPEVNSGWENDGIVRFGRVNVGFAVALEGGLVVPVVQNAERKTLGEIARTSKDLIDRARSGKLSPTDYETGTFTISNLGMFGIEEFTAILNPPEACILAVGAITPSAVVVNGEIAVRDRMKATMTCDHRVINGAMGAEYLRTFKTILEEPLLALI